MLILKWLLLLFGAAAVIAVVLLMAVLFLDCLVEKIEKDKKP